MRKALCLFLVLILICFAGCATTGSGGNSRSETVGGSEGHVHEYSLVKPKSPTCTEKGNSIYYTCSCGKIFAKRGVTYVETTLDAVTLKMKGHNYEAERISEEYFVSEATETTPQVFAKSCISCGKKAKTILLLTEKHLKNIKRKMSLYINRTVSQ